MTLSRSSNRTNRVGTVAEEVANEETMVEEVVTGVAAVAGREGAEEDVADAVHELRDRILGVNRGACDNGPQSPLPRRSFWPHRLTPAHDQDGNGNCTVSEKVASKSGLVCRGTGAGELQRPTTDDRSSHGTALDVRRNHCRVDLTAREVNIELQSKMLLLVLRLGDGGYT